MRPRAPVVRTAPRPPSMPRTSPSSRLAALLAGALAISSFGAACDADDPAPGPPSSPVDGGVVAEAAPAGDGSLAEAGPVARAFEIVGGLVRVRAPASPPDAPPTAAVAGSAASPKRRRVVVTDRDSRALAIRVRSDRVVRAAATTSPRRVTHHAATPRVRHGDGADVMRARRKSFATLSWRDGPNNAAQGSWEGDVAEPVASSGGAFSTSRRIALARRSLVVWATASRSVADSGARVACVVGCRVLWRGSPRRAGPPRVALPLGTSLRRLDAGRRRRGRARDPRLVGGRLVEGAGVARAASGHAFAGCPDGAVGGWCADASRDEARRPGDAGWSLLIIRWWRHPAHLRGRPRHVALTGPQPPLTRGRPVGTRRRPRGSPRGPRTKARRPFHHGQPSSVVFHPAQHRIPRPVGGARRVRLRREDLAAPRGRDRRRRP